MTEQELRSLIRETLVESMNEAKATFVFYPTRVDFNTNDKTLHLDIFEVNADGKATNISGSGTIGKLYPEDIKLQIEKYGVPSAKEIKANKLIDGLFWKASKKLGTEGYKLVQWKKFGNGSTSDMGFAYVGDNSYEIHLDLPRGYRHQDESNPTPEFIKFFDSVDEEIQKISDKIEKLGFKVEVSAMPQGFQNS